MAEPTVGDIMERDPATVSPRTDVTTLIKLLQEHELPGVPVVQDDGTLVGIVTESDLVLHGDDSSLHLPQPVHEAAQLISRTGHNRIPVVEGRKLVGVVTRVDALDGLTRAVE